VDQVREHLKAPTLALSADELAALENVTAWQNGRAMGQLA
jgi:hypothetical protein